MRLALVPEIWSDIPIAFTDLQEGEAKTQARDIASSHQFDGNVSHYDILARGRRCKLMTALALPTKAHALLTLLGEGTLLFLAFLLSAGRTTRGAWDSGRISTKRYIAFCGLFTAILVLVAAAVVMIRWPTWVRVSVIAPAALAFGAHMWGFWPRSTRQWRLYGIVLACFTVFCVVMTCAFHV